MQTIENPMAIGEYYPEEREPDKVCPHCGVGWYKFGDYYEGDTKATSRPLSASEKYCEECIEGVADEYREDRKRHQEYIEVLMEGF